MSIEPPHFNQNWEQVGARNRRRKEAVLSAYKHLNAGDKAVIDDCVFQLCLGTHLGKGGALELLAAIGIHSIENENPLENKNLRQTSAS